ncbi:hypothetical protein CC79DRAFT_1367600 [Sarocladium strictum]
MALTHSDARTLSTCNLPNGDSIILDTSTFFTRNKNARLPTPSEVLSRAASGCVAHDTVHLSQQPALFEELGLIVKYGKGPKVTVAEGQCLWALRRYLPQVPVPEIYGWVTEGENVFLNMELIDGVGLDLKWDQLPTEEREGVCEHLRGMLVDLRQLRPDSNDVFLGQINRQPYNDVMFTNGVRPRAGPFTSVKDFHDWLSLMSKLPATRHFPGKTVEEIPDPYRRLLSDDAGIVFTHADLHPSNITVCKTEPHRILAIIDWGQSGWFRTIGSFARPSIRFCLSLSGAQSIYPVS